VAGIFVVEVEGIEEKAMRGVASLGINPTVTEVGHHTLEVFLFDFERQLYGQRIEVRFLKKLRDEEKFSSVNALTEQISRDVAAAHRYFDEVRSARRRDASGEQ
jgi:riboflavin kinase/FMN adenylyltransferase